jgi:hypothetical protein
MLGQFFSGFACATFAASALFFLKFWLVSRDRFFLIFGGAFGLMALERCIGIFFWAIQDFDLVYGEGMRIWLYLMRLSAFALIVAGFVQKNRKSQP